MPTPRGELAAAAFNGRIHVVGGVTPAGPLDAHEAYDPRERRWLPLHPMPTAALRPRRRGRGRPALRGRGRRVRATGATRRRRVARAPRAVRTRGAGMPPGN